MPRYSDILLDHFRNPRNLGRMDNPDGTALVCNPVCGDEMHLDLCIRDGTIQAARFLTRGCTAAIAASSMVTEMILGLTLEQALALREEQIANALGGLPAEKLHCSVLGHQAIIAAIADYRSRRSQ
jgi:nitrogen fixation protein NifU and related proteins